MKKRTWRAGGWGQTWELRSLKFGCGNAPYYYWTGDFLKIWSLLFSHHIDTNTWKKVEFWKFWSPLSGIQKICCNILNLDSELHHVTNGLVTFWNFEDMQKSGIWNILIWNSETRLQYLKFGYGSVSLNLWVFFHNIDPKY